MPLVQEEMSGREVRVDNEVEFFKCCFMTAMIKRSNPTTAVV